jgi:hypothetical protein
MLTKKVDDGFVNDLRKISKDAIPKQIEKLLMESNGKGLAACLDQIMRKDCIYFCRIYKELFIIMDLDDYEGDETGFELIL